MPEALAVSERVSLLKAAGAMRRAVRSTSLKPLYIQADVAGLATDVRGYDPHIALTPGGDGLDPYRAILAASASARAQTRRLHRLRIRH